MLGECPSENGFLGTRRHQQSFLIAIADVDSVVPQDCRAEMSDDSILRPVTSFVFPNLNKELSLIRVSNLLAV